MPLFLRYAKLRELWKKVKTSGCILMVNLSKSWGGGEKWFSTVGAALAEAGWKVEMAVYPGSPLEKRMLDSNIPLYPISIRFLSLLNPIKFFQLRHIIQKSQPDYLLMNASHELKTFGLMGHMLGVPHLIFRRGVSYALEIQLAESLVYQAGGYGFSR